MTIMCMLLWQGPNTPLAGDSSEKSTYCPEIMRTVFLGSEGRPVPTDTNLDYAVTVEVSTSPE